MHLMEPGVAGRVERGQVIGVVGSPGPHLHFAVSSRPGRDGWRWFEGGRFGGGGDVDPLPVLAGLR